MENSEYGFSSLPHSLEAEEALIFALLTRSDAISDLSDLAPTDFFDQTLADFYSRILKMGEANIPVDFITLASDVSGVPGALDKLEDIQERLFTAGNVPAYAKLVKDASKKRKTYGVLQRAAMRALSGEEDPEELVSSMDTEFVEVFRNSQSLLSNTTEIVPTVLTQIEEYLLSPTGVKLGFDKFDKMTGGFLPGEYIVVGGRPSMGKTAWAMQGAFNAAGLGYKPGVISIEMTKEALVKRQVCQEAGLTQEDLRRPLTERQAMALAEGAARVAALDVWIADQGVFTLQGVIAATRKAVRKHGCNLIVIDYLQLIEGTGKGSLTEDVTIQSRAIKNLARSLGVPIIVLSQLSRKVEERKNRRPMMSDLRESGAIEQDADTIILLYRDNYYEEDTRGDPGIAEVILGKQRNGPVGTVPMMFDPPTTKFTDCEWGQDPSHAGDPSFVNDDLGGSPIPNF